MRRYVLINGNWEPIPMWSIPRDGGEGQILTADRTGLRWRDP